MASESVSFRITRTTEDLAQTVSALSQRLVKLEQRLAGIELQFEHQLQPAAAELVALDHAERLLLDCRYLLEESATEVMDPLPRAEQAVETHQHPYAA